MVKIELFPVISSNIEKIGYDAPSQTMRVQFKTGATYDYLGVSKDVYETLRMSESIGTSLRHMIKGTYEFIKVS